MQSQATQMSPWTSIRQAAHDFRDGRIDMEGFLQRLELITSSPSAGLIPANYDSGCWPSCDCPDEHQDADHSVALAYAVDDF